MRNSTKTLLKALGIVVAVAGAVSVGYFASGLQARSIGGGVRGAASSIGTSTQDMTTGKSAGASVGSPAPGIGALGAPSPETPPSSSASVSSPGSPTTDRLVISTSVMSLHVGSVEKSIQSIRKLAAEYGAVISDLTLDAGSQPATGPLPLQRDAATSSLPSPASAQITLRVPSAKLDRVQSEAVKLGDVISQNASESDVTQQHIDLVARLKNLVAEESRLREFLKRATKVSEMLDVERELSRVRGEIESMQAQIAYLEHQAALSTLTIDLSESGPVVRPSASGWGFVDAVTNGVQAAAAVVRFFISGTIALSPFLVVVVLGWIAWRATKRRRKNELLAQDAGSGDHHTPESDDSDTSPVE